MKIFLKSFFLLLPLVAGLCVMNSCHKELFSTKGALSFSSDTLTFDTVFTTLGSVTQSFTVRNTQSKSINISDIKLMQLAGTQFRINVNGQPAYKAGLEYKNIDIPAHDSIYIFVEVTINPNAANNPFVVLDQIQFVTNGITQDVVLEAMGQNAHYYFSFQVTSANTPFTFPTDKPNIIVNKNGGLPIFAVDSHTVCNIPPGTKIFMAPGAVFTVDGTLNATGTSWSDSTIFQYIRTDYGGLPGEWLGITYSRIATINLSHVIIDQSTFGLSDEYVLDAIAGAQITTSNLNTYISDQTPLVTLNNVIIRNTTSTALTAIRTTLVANNCLFHSCSQNLVQVGMGGTYNFNNCTLANSYNIYTSSTSQNPLLNIFDQVYYLGIGPMAGPYATTVTVNNTIIAGSTSSTYNELSFGFAQRASDNITFNNCFLTESKDTLSAHQITNINGIDTAVDPQYSLSPPLFANPTGGNYMPDTASIVIGKGNDSTHLDLYDYSRSPNPCIGAIQWHH